jgi:hypothetical protein
MADIHMITPIPWLRELRDAVLERSHKRMPKWKFRLAPDLVVQIQPQTARLTRSGIHVEQFNGTAVMTDDANVDMLKRLPKIDRDWWLLHFEIYGYEKRKHDDLRVPALWHADHWHVEKGGWWCKRGADRAGLDALFSCLIAALSDDFFSKLTPDLLLAHNCLICGKGLTDPASMARGIGPECWGSSSLHVPFVIESVKADGAVQ